MQLFLRVKWFVLAVLTVLLSIVFVQDGSARVLASDNDASAANTLYLAQVKRDLPLLNDAVQSIEPKASAGTVFQSPVDATLDPDAKTIFFVANSAQGMGVFKTGISGGAVVSLTVGAPFTQPLGLDISTDGQTIFVADPSVPVQSQFRRSQFSIPPLLKGMLFRVSVTGGPAVAVAGTECTAPRGLTVVKENGVDMIYFTGVDPNDGQAALLKIPAAGGVLTILTKGDPLVQPTGIAVSKDNMLYVTDQGSATSGLGNVFRFHNTSVENDHTGQASNAATAALTPDEPQPSHNEILATVRGGNPAGVALTLDGTLLLVSSHDGTLGTSQVLVINTTTLQQGIVNTVIGANHASGGLHRAYNSTEMVWIDRAGLVYVVKLKP